MVQYYKRKVIYSNGSVHYKYYKLYSNGRMVKVLKYEYMKGQCAKSKTGGVPPLDLTKGYQGDSFQKYYIEYMSTDNINSTKYTGIEAKIAMEFERVYVDLYNKNIMNETGCNMDNYRKASDIDKAAMNELNKKMALYFYTIATIQYPRILYKNFEFLVHNIYKNGRFINNFDKLYKDITKLHIDKECIYLFHAIRANPKIIEQQYVDMKLDTAPVKYLPDDLKIICENGLNPDVVDAGFFPDSHNRPYVDLGKQYLAGTYSGANFYSDRFTTDSSGLILVIKIPIVIAWNYEFVFNSMDHIYTSIKITQEYIYVSSQDECFMQKKEYEKIRAVSYNGFNDYISHTELTIIPLNEYYTKYYNKGPYTGNCKSHNEINGGFNDYPIMIKVGKKWRLRSWRSRCRGWFGFCECASGFIGVWIFD